MIKPDCYKHIGKLIDAIYVNGFKINKMRMSRFSPATAAEFYAEHKQKPFFPSL
jgi:nucleoside-diphosphate kinase